MSAKILRGRAAESATLRELLTRVGSAESRVLVLRGEAGVGKSALLDVVVDEAKGFGLVQVSGVESDMELAHAGLQPRNVSAAELAGGFGTSLRRTSASQIEDGFLRRIEVLPASTRRLLLVAAAEPVGDAALFLRAAAGLGIPVDALAPAEADGVIDSASACIFNTR